MRVGLLLIILLFGSVAVLAQAAARVAIVDLVGDERGEVTALLRTAARGFSVVDEEQMRAAVRGAGYGGSLNLSREEARALGMSIGCDFYLLGKTGVVRHIVSATEFSYTAYAGIFLVETRSGRLILFSFERTQSSEEAQARAQLAAAVKRAWARQADAIKAANEKSLAASEVIPRAPGEVIEVLTDEPDGKGTAQPVFYQRLKPAYTEEAGLADITATVELEAVFGADGRVGEVEVVRWAGFGLDESAAATVRSLRFKPAERAGKKLTIRALVRYNFRRSLSATGR